MSEAQSSTAIEAVIHYKKKLLRHVDDESPDIILHCLAKLDRVPMTIEILQETGVGRVVNQLKKTLDTESLVAEEAKNIKGNKRDGRIDIFPALPPIPETEP